MRKSIVVLVALAIIFSSFCYAINFSDVASDHWAYQYITELSDKQVINGYPDGTFNPNGTITRGEFCKLVMASCLPTWLDMSEAESTMDHWAGGYISLAETYGIIEQGAINVSNVNEPITRLEMVKMISLADIVMKENQWNFTDNGDFKDTLTLSMQDLYLLRHASNRGLVSGYPDGTFLPDNSMTRAEAATMIYRFTK